MTNPVDDVADVAPPRPTPDDLGPAGARLWRAVVDVFDLADHEAELLRQAAVTADTIADLDAVVTAEGVIADSSQGQRAHPALVEARQQRVMLARLIAALRLPADTVDPDDDPDPDGDNADGPREQRRSGFRGVYSIAGGA